MSKKRLSSNPLDDLDILKGPDKKGGKDTRKSTSENTGINTRENTSKNTSVYTGKNTSVLTKKPDLVKMTFYFYRDQLKQLDKLSKQTGRPKTELIRLALDRFFEQVRQE